MLSPHRTFPRRADGRDRRPARSLCVRRRDGGRHHRYRTPDRCGRRRPPPDSDLRVEGAVSVGSATRLETISNCCGAKRALISALGTGGRCAFRGDDRTRTTWRTASQASGISAWGYGYRGHGVSGTDGLPSIAEGMDSRPTIGSLRLPSRRLDRAG